MDWKWPENRVLNRMGRDSPCGDIFQSVCNVLKKKILEGLR